MSKRPDSKPLIPAFDPRKSTPEGLVAVGGNLEFETLEEAYRLGIFPWPQEGMPLLWFSPDPRGVLDFDELHVPRSLRKWERQHSHWKYTLNKAFSQVIHHCRLQKRPGQDGTWILPQMEKAYRTLFDRGRVLSLEVWDGEDLIGGIYGVMCVNAEGKMHFSGESMFHLKANASKMALVKLVEHLKSQGQTWMDIQMLTDVTTALGGKYISREDFLGRLGV
jgi:leucyl/phenylalanyl-tRNA--protein transferase